MKDRILSVSKQVTRIDGELVQLFLERMAVTGKVGEYKQRAGIPVLDAGREKQVIAAKTALTDDPARKADVAASTRRSWPFPAASSAMPKARQPSGQPCGVRAVCGSVSVPIAYGSSPVCSHRDFGYLSV